MILLFLVFLGPSMTGSMPSAKEVGGLCQVECQGVATRPVCGTDGVTYPSRCSLQRSVCSGVTVRLRHRGSCHSQADGSHCLEEKRNALRTGDESGIPIFVPECREDGGYKEAQCHKGTGYCWCVNKEGKPVPGSSVQHSKPLCNLLLETGRWRRGKRRKGSRSKESGEREGRRKQVCTQADRSAFSNNLIEMVSTEHSGLFGAKGRPNGTIIGNARKEVAEWKFDQLDSDRDGVLKKKELKAFRSDIKKVLRPRRCGSSFTRYCDQDTDRKISQQEWRSCIGIEENISFNLFSKLTSEEDEQRRAEERKQKVEESWGSSKSSFQGQQQDQAAPPSLYTRQFAASRELEVEEVEAEATEPMDCVSARLESAQEVLQGSEGMFIPECDRQGRYLQVQCYKSEGYCWCVEPATGRPIPGTSTRDSAPQCGQSGHRARAQPKIREWKKCEGRKRDTFLKQLFSWMRLQVQNKSLPFMLDEEPGLTQNQLIAKKQFIDLDTNRNGILERRELRRWKRAMKEEAGLTLCGKRISQHCDSNGDSSISQGEWTACLGVATEADVVTRRPFLPVSKRRGPNPLKTWLKGD